MNEKKHDSDRRHKPLARPLRFDTFEKAAVHRAKLKAKRELMDKKVDKIKITRRGPKKTTKGEYFEVVPYSKIMPKKSLEELGELGEAEGGAVDVEPATNE